MGAPGAAAAGARPRFGAFLFDAALFDADVFAVSAVEAQLMDPQQRLLLECAAESLLGAHASLNSSDVKVSVGITAQARSPPTP